MNRVVLEACLPWMIVLVACCVALVVLARLSGARLCWTRLRSLHRSQAGNVQSLSLVITLPIFLMIVMFIVQVSQILVGMVVVHYAAFAAARAAIVWLPANVPSGYESANRVELLKRQSGNTYQITGGRKFEKIRLAAVMACAPICPSRDVVLSTEAAALEVASVAQAVYANLAPQSRLNSRISARLANKIAFSFANTHVEITGIDKDDHAHGPTYNPHRLDPPFDQNQIGWHDPITITVRHDFALLPGPGRLLARAVRARDGSPDRLSRRISPHPRAEYREKRTSDQRSKERVYVYPIFASATLTNEGIKSVKPYVQTTW